MLAHGGGVPEVLSVLGPLVVLGALVLMERRARRAARERPAPEQAPEQALPEADEVP